VRRARLLTGDVLERLGELEDGTFDAVLTDPPYGLSFMGRAWDHSVPSAVVWREVLRVLKPGAPLLAFGGTRTYHRLACAIEDAGFEIRDSLLAGAWTYGSGFPKSLDISKGIDKAAGAERQEVGRKAVGFQNLRGDGFGHGGTDADGLPVTAPATTAAALWSGYGTALKPAWEPVVLAMKPLAGTFAANALEHGVAGLNIDGARTRADGGSPAEKRRDSARRSGSVPTYHGDADARREMEAAGRVCSQTSPERYLQERPGEQLGRWPSNLLLTHHPSCREVGTRKVKSQSPSVPNPRFDSDDPGSSLEFKAGKGRDGTMSAGYADGDGTETVPAYDCHPDCPVAALDRQAGELTSGKMLAGTRRSQGGGYRGGFPGEATRTDTPGDSGGASRFYFQATFEEADFLIYRAKADRAEREIGMAPGERCQHPTLKPISLAAYLAKLILPPPRDGSPRRLLVPFAGAGSEIIGALRAGWEEVVGIELEPEHVEWAEARVRGDAPLLNTVEVEPP
jgi:predicted RNA methylase